MSTKLDPKHKRLADRFLVHMNASRAARETGYRKAGARARASEILARPEVKEYVDAENKKLNEEERLTARLVREELAVVAHSNITDYVVTKNGRVKLAPGVPSEAWRAVSSVECSISKTGKYSVKIRLWDKGAAIRAAGDHLGMFKQIVETRDRTFEDALDELDAADDARERISARLDKLAPATLEDAPDEIDDDTTSTNQ